MALTPTSGRASRMAAAGGPRVAAAASLPEADNVPFASASPDGAAPERAGAGGAARGGLLARLMANPYTKTIVCGAGFAADAYDLFVIDSVASMIKLAHGQTAADKALVSNAALIGSVLGQVFFGFAGDVFGRKANFVVTAALIIGGALLSATPTAAYGPTTLHQLLAAARFMLGFGVGGEYPLSSTMTSESATFAGRGRAVASVFAMQGVGKLAAALINYMVVSGSDYYVAGGISLDGAWRFALAFGAVPSIATIYLRWHLHESEIFHHVIAEDKSTDPDAVDVTTVSMSPLARAVERTGSGGSYGASGDEVRGGAAVAAADSGGGRAGGDALTPTAYGAAAMQIPIHVPAHTDWRLALMQLWEFRWVLLGTASTWFLLDVTFYGQGLLNTTIVQSAIFGVAGIKCPPPCTTRANCPSECIDELRNGTLGAFAIVAIALPGYFVAVLTIDRIGRWWMGVMGFAVSALLFAILAGAYGSLRTQPGLFLVIYGLTYFFANFGPNTSTFVMPAEAFPTRIRSTAHGISAASGKIGATLGATFLVLIYNSFCEDGTCKTPSSPGVDQGVVTVMWICAGVCLVGLAAALAFTRETMHRTLAEVDASSRYARRAPLGAAAAVAASPRGSIVGAKRASLSSSA